MDEDEDLNGVEGDEIQSQIGRQLRSMYDSILSEPIPDSIVELLVKLDDVQLARAAGDQSEQQ